MRYQYDNASRRTQMTVSGQTNSVTYGYDNGDRLTQISQGTGTVAFGYDAAGRRTSLTLPNGIVVGYSYDQASELAGLTYTLSSNPLGGLAYGYDNDGRRIGLAGSWARTGIPKATGTATYNVASQVTGWNGATLMYDANGNMTSDGTNTFSWDARNQLSGISGVVSASFAYDPFGRRQGKTIGSTATNYLYDGLNPIQELSGTTVNANLLTAGIDEYFTRTDSLGTSSFLSDALGSTLALADTTGTVQTSYTYQPFGGTTTQGSSSANSYQFTGRENDGDGLYFYRARYYSPMLGRFISEDPAGFLGGIDFYSYAGGEPTTDTDPTGKYVPWVHTSITEWAAGAVGLDPVAAAELAAAVAAVDFEPGSQGVDAPDANTHAMAGRKPNGHWQSACEAYQATRSQLEQDIRNGEIAKALHTIQDATAPAHSGYQPWHGHLTSQHFQQDVHPERYEPDAVSEAEARSAQFLEDWKYGQLGNPAKYLSPDPCK